RLRRRRDVTRVVPRSLHEPRTKEAVGSLAAYFVRGSSRRSPAGALTLGEVLPDLTEQGSQRRGGVGVLLTEQVVAGVDEHGLPPGLLAQRAPVHRAEGAELAEAGERLLRRGPPRQQRPHLLLLRREAGTHLGFDSLQLRGAQLLRVRRKRRAP